MIIKKMIRRIPLTCVLIAQSCFAQTAPSGAEPKFSDYPARVSSHAGSASPKLTTPGQRKFQTMIRDGAARGPNFAGHFTIAEWGCGTSCVQFAVIDNESGAVYESPFGSLPKADICLGGGDPDDTGVFYKPDSSLLIVRGCPNFKDCATFYYLWTGTQFKVLRRVPMAPVVVCEQ
jgi:hypothetical protein